ncbi:hypothetical protein [Spirosoma jeollabukense]
MNKFNSEAEMAKHFFSYIKGGSSLVLQEYQGLFGIPDFILFDSSLKNEYYIISVELKLKNWRRALIQAFRYLNFSNKSFVILDEKYVNPAINNLAVFKQYNIGLGSFNVDQELKIYYNPTDIQPFNLQITEKLLHSADSARKRRKKSLDINKAILFERSYSC